ncbi:hypothetical protein [Sphingobium yanoikuyae]|uniref:hypothetical protein n=1 Tax=Sphingobium yanoikuyae TaxID=13690 RepID=UPI00345E0EBB
MSERGKWHERLKVHARDADRAASHLGRAFPRVLLWAAISCAKAGRFASFPLLFVIGSMLAVLMSGLFGMDRQGRMARLL